MSRESSTFFRRCATSSAHRRFLGVQARGMTRTVDDVSANHRTQARPASEPPTRRPRPISQEPTSAANAPALCTRSPK